MTSYSPNKNYIDVTAALIIKDEKLLITRRALPSSFSGTWEFPGGKIELKETPKECLKRELFEELDIEVSVGKLFLIWKHDYNRGDKKEHRFFAFPCVITKGEPYLNVHDKMIWVKKEELQNFNFIEADKHLIKELDSNSTLVII